MRFIAILFVGLMLTAGAVRAEETKDAPIPVLDTGGHMALIKDIAFTPDGRQIVSAGEDKTIRVWDVAAEKTVRTIRGEIAPGGAGKILAMALSPNGKWLAVGGMFHQTNAKAGSIIRIYDFASGQLVALLKGHKNVVVGLAFSPDSRHLISGSADKTAIIWDVVSGEALRRLKGHRSYIFAVGFTPDGARAVTGSSDHELRLWSVADGVLLATMTGHKDKVYSLAIAPDGTIASGDDSGEIRLWNGQTGRFLKTFARQKTKVGNLSFSPDGTRLLSSCGQYCEGKFKQIVYDTSSGRESVIYRGHDNIVIATAISPNGRWAATGGGNNNEIHIWDLSTGGRRLGADGQPLTLGGSGRPVWAVGFSRDGLQIGWRNAPDYDSAQPKLSRGQLSYALTLPAGDVQLSGPIAIAEGKPSVSSWRHAVAELGGWSLKHRKGGPFGRDAILDIKQDGRVVASIQRTSADGYVHRAYTFTPDGLTIISGGANGALSAYDRKGRKLGAFLGHEGDIWAVATSPDGRYLVSGANDQTLRLWNLKTRELLVTLFSGADGEWVMWTPQGYYAASGPGAELIGWQINHGPKNAAEYFTAAQLRKSLNRSDIVAKAIQLASAEEAIRQSHGTGFKLTDLLKKPVPRFRIVSPTANATLAGGATQLELKLVPTPDPVRAIRIQVNGRQLAEHLPQKGSGFTPGTLKFPVSLTKGRNVIRVVAVNDTGETPHDDIVTHQGAGALDKRGTLYILAIGVDQYPKLGKSCRNPDGTPKVCDLRLAGADAKAFADTMEARLGTLHESVVKRVLVNGSPPADVPTVVNIVDALGELRNAKPNDTIMMFISGHGATEGLNYNFLPTEAAFSGDALRASTVVPWARFQLAIEAAKGRRILFLDTCHSGNSYNQRLTNDAYQANIVVYAAARWDQEALERYDIGHGLFTYAVVEGMKGAAKNKAGEIRAESLRDYVRKRVTEMAREMQHNQEAQYFRGRDAGNYLLVGAQ